MWSILERRRVDRHVNVAPREVLVRYEKWKEVVALSGPAGLRRIKGFHDESLTREVGGTSVIAAWDPVESHLSGRGLGDSSSRGLRDGS